MRTAAEDTPRGRCSIRARIGDVAISRRNTPEHSAITPPGLRVLSTLGRDTPAPAGEITIAIAITPTVVYITPISVCITAISVCNAPLAVGDTPLGTRITHADL